MVGLLNAKGKSENKKKEDRLMLKEYLEKAKDYKRKKEVKERKKAAAKIGAGLAAGSIIGLAAGILLAPKAGKEVRGDFAKKATDIIHQGKELIQEKKVRLTGLREMIAEKVNARQSEAAEPQSEPKEEN